MRLLIQRVLRSSVAIGGVLHSRIGQGLLVFVGIEEGDTAEDIKWLAAKTAKLRIFADQRGVMNLDVVEAGGEIMVVSQFTLHASTRKGNRPSYIRSAPEATARPLYEEFVHEMELVLGHKIATGSFGADMQIELVNDGPVTIWIDSKNRE